MSSYTEFEELVNNDVDEAVEDITLNEEKLRTTLKKAKKDCFDKLFDEDLGYMKHEVSSLACEALAHVAALKKINQYFYINSELSLPAYLSILTRTIQVADSTDDKMDEEANENTTLKTYTVEMISNIDTMIVGSVFDSKTLAVLFDSYTEPPLVLKSVFLQYAAPKEMAIPMIASVEQYHVCENIEKFADNEITWPIACTIYHYITKPNVSYNRLDFAAVFWKQRYTKFISNGGKLVLRVLKRAPTSMLNFYTSVMDNQFEEYKHQA